MSPLIKRTVKTIASHIFSQIGPHKYNLGSPKLWILMYHRVLPINDLRYDLEEPGMIVTPETFAMHIRYIKSHFTVMPLEHWINLKKTNQTLPQKACAITFDDGWLDNYEYAFPILEREKIPFTLFTVAEKIGSNFQFWPNIIAYILFNGHQDLLKSCKFYDSTLESLILKNNRINKELVAQVIAHLKQYSDTDIFQSIMAIHGIKEILESMPRALMNWDEINNMQKSGLLAIGSHTCSHKRLVNGVSKDELMHEISESKSIISEKIKKPVNLFCFPNGDYSKDALDLVKKNYTAAVTTQRGIVNSQGSVDHELTRIALHEEISNAPNFLGARLSGWL